MKVKIINAELAAKALKSNRTFTVGQTLEADNKLLEIAMFAEPEAFENLDAPKVKKKEERKEKKKEVIKENKQLQSKDKKQKKGNFFKTKGW